jgi:hypothetical protein
MARVTKPGGRVAVIEGGMSVMDLPLPELSSRILGDYLRTRSISFGASLYGLLLDAGLQRVRSIPVTTVEHEPDSYFLTYARGMAESATSDGTATVKEAADWLEQVEARSRTRHWFNADCFFIATGIVPNRKL